MTAHQAALVCVFEPAKRKEWQQEYLERLCQFNLISSLVGMATGLSSTGNLTTGLNLAKFRFQFLAHLVAFVRLIISELE